MWNTISLSIINHECILYGFLAFHEKQHTELQTSEKNNKKCLMPAKDN